MSGTCLPYLELEDDLAEYFAATDALGRAEALSGARAEERPPLSPLAWAEACRRIDDRPFTIERFRPLREIYDEDHPFVVIMKPAQVGVSEMAITRAVHALDAGARYWQTDKSGLNVAYLFPTQAALSDFSKERFSSLREESDYLGGLFTDYDDVHFKQAGASYLYLRGAWSTKALKSFPADVLFLDEFDEMARAAVALASKRLRQSGVKRQWRFSTPTYPGVGIHAEYLKSDQRVWEVRCDSCGAWNELDFFRDVRVDGHPWEAWRDWGGERIGAADITVACPSCRGALDRFGEGRWTARRPEVTRIRGYHVPALCFPSVSLAELCVTAVSDDPNEVAEFYRSDLGLPYEPAGSRVTEAMLKQLSAPLDHGRLPAGPWTDVTMGVDVGARYHYRVSGTGPDKRRCVLVMGAVRSWDELDGLMEAHHVRAAVVDAMPELNGAEDWSRRHKGKVLRAFYKDLKGELFRLPAAEEKERHGLKVERPKVLQKDTVLVDRTMAMDTVYNRIALAKEAWPAEVHNAPEVVAHMTAPVRVVKEDEEGQARASWVHTKPDHLYHACVYDLIALKTLPRRLPGVLAQGAAKIRLPVV
jgi:hypothetical protein